VKFHYSQEGEDLLLERIFINQTSGFYIDVGAHHPFRFSNTYWAYRRGWSGVNIDAAPGSTKLFDRWRPRDLNFESCIGAEDGVVEYTVYSEPALNTLDANRVNYLTSAKYRPKDTIGLKSRRLDNLLGEIFDGKSVPVIDFLSIDVEGSEMDVLKSNDWSRFKPRVIVIEILGNTLSNVSGSAEYQFLTNMGYVPVSMLYHSVIFVGDERLLAEHWS
jgi:FkbM family methyltransferase